MKSAIRCLLFACALLLLSRPTSAAPADSIAATVGDELILESELQQTILFMRIASQDTVTPDSTLRNIVLNRLIDDLLLEEQARRESIVVEQSEVTAEVDENLASLRQRFDDPEEFKAALQAEGLTERTLRQRYEKEIRGRLLARRLLEKEGLTQIYISPAEAERFYNENRDSIARIPAKVTLAHILVAIKPSDSSEMAGRQRASEVLDLLAGGGEFPALARSFSDDPRTAPKGGDWGWVNRDSLAPELVMVTDQLKPGQIAPPFRIPEGYLILKLDDRARSRVRFRTILIRVPITRADTIRARSRAEAVRRKILAGADFDSLARSLSDDPATAESGGYLGDFTLLGLAPPFDRVVAGLDSGQVSEPVLSEHGFHIVLVLDKEPERTLSYLELQDSIRNYLYQEHLTKRLRQYLDRIALTTYIKRFGTP
ncbi:MAG: peptidylprolyl isomerase [candidate division WOR-3 bacterium]